MGAKLQFLVIVIPLLDAKIHPRNDPSSNPAQLALAANPLPNSAHLWQSRQEIRPLIFQSPFRKSPKCNLDSLLHQGNRTIPQRICAFPVYLISGDLL
jgi:hypothetical protein